MRSFFLVMGVLSLLNSSVAFALPNSTPEEGGDDRVVVTVQSLRNARGTVWCLAYDGPENFPEGTQRVIARVAARPNGSSAQCVFSSLPRARSLAVVVHHDENDDRVFQRGIFGIPLEGYGFSNDVRPVLAPPSFADCRFQFGGGVLSMRITARY